MKQLLLIIIIILLLIIKCKRRNIEGFTTIDINNLKNIKVMSSNDRAVIMHGNRILVDEYNKSINVVIINKDDKVEYIGKFCNKYYEIKELTELLASVPDHYIVIIATTKRPFMFMFNELHNELSKLGFKSIPKKDFPYTMNYILIGNKINTVYYENMSDQTIFFPNYKIKDIACKKNPFTIFPLNKYIFFRDVIDKYESINRCAMETKRGNNSLFAIADNKCIPLTGNDYDKIRKMDDSSTCIDGHGNIESLNVYDIVDTNNKSGAYVFTYDRIKRLLPIGKYSRYMGHIILDSIMALDVPENYVIYLVDQYDRLYTIYGKKVIANVRDLDKDFRYIKELHVEYVDDKTKICDSKNCLAFSKGRHRLSPYQYMKVNRIAWGTNDNKVILYDDMGFNSVIDQTDKGREVTNPSKISRAVEII